MYDTYNQKASISHNCWLQVILTADLRSFLCSSRRVSQ